MGEIEFSRWVDENWGDLRVKFLTDCAHSEHVFTVRREVLLSGDGEPRWEHNADVEHGKLHPEAGAGVRFRAAFEDAVFDGELGEPGASVEAAIAAVPGWPCTAAEAGL